MEHNGISYSVVQTASPTGWKWTIHVPGNRPKSGTAFNRAVAVSVAKIAIERAIKVTLSKPASKQ
jgi:hypothetical protein